MRVSGRTTRLADIRPLFSSLLENKYDVYNRTTIITHRHSLLGYVHVHVMTKYAVSQSKHNAIVRNVGISEVDKKKTWIENKTNEERLKMTYEQLYIIPTIRKGK